MDYRVLIMCILILVSGIITSGCIDDRQGVKDKIDDQETMFTITATTDGEGSISPDGKLEVVEHENITFSFKPEMNYRVEEVLIDGQTIGIVFLFTFTNVTENHTIHVSFSQDSITHTILSSADPGGSIWPKDEVLVSHEHDISFTITPVIGHAISDVMVDGMSLGPVSTYSFSWITDNHTISATFKLMDFHLTVSTTGEGTVSIDPDLDPIPYGTVVTMTASAGSDWLFSRWTGALSSMSNPAKITITANLSVSAIFISPTGQSVKIMTYNVKDGGWEDEWLLVAQEENADIIMCIETGTWDNWENDWLNYYVDELNNYFPDEEPYVGYCTQGIEYEAGGEAILSRYPIIDFDQVALLTLDNGEDYEITHQFIDVTATVNSIDIHFIGTHLKASSGWENEERRDREMEGIINYIDELGAVPVMLMGDLNSFSPFDTGSLAPNGDLGDGPLTMLLQPDDPNNGQYSSDGHTFTDVFRTLNPSLKGYTYGHQDSQYKSRIDYILMNSYFPVSLVSSTCGDTPSADEGSDHYSVDVVLSF